ncbi:metallophosphoesterase [Candidatus Saccharibacteria bacterium]|nr:metallophosphoesterase [Candidatus Saccharibacteria bacterium]
MNCFYHSRYRFYNKNAKHGLKFFLISDIHFSHRVSPKTLRAITLRAHQEAPNYILIAGDLIDSLNHIEKSSDLKRLTSWLEQLGKVAPVLIGLGNHEFYRKNPNYKNLFSRQKHWFAEKNQPFLNAINSIDNVQILDNQSYEDQNVYIFGFTQTPDYFRFDKDDHRAPSIFHPGCEDHDIMVSDLDALDQKLITNLPKHKVKIAIIHSPTYLTDSEIASKLYEFDFFISGHMHNGVVPPIINDIWRSDRGFISASRKLFPHGVRTNIRNPSDKIIILGAVTTIQDSAQPFTFANGLYPTNIATLELKNLETLIRKPDVKHSYISYK